MATTTTQATPQSERASGRTRARILRAAYQEIYRNGYQGMRLDDILATTGLTKGALYYHFPNKLALGHAVVDEIIEDMVIDLWIRPMEIADEPLNALIERVLSLDEIAGDQVATLGCPLNNLAQEMSPLDEGFRQRLDRVFEIWHRGLVTALERSKKNHQMRPDVDTRQTATIVMAALEGGIGLTKNCQRLERLRECTTALAGYLETLRLSPSM